MAGSDQDGSGENAGASLAVVYALGLSLLFLVPWTLLSIVRMFGKKSSLSKLGRIFALGVAWWTFYYATSFVEVANERFDPYEILSIGPGASMKQIKKSYRKMSLVHHPDKEGGDAEQFALVAKAYEALTDPAANANWKRYGHPDGYQSMAIGVGLPTWMTSGERGGMVLAAYFSLFVGIFTVLGYKYMKSSTPYASVKRIPFTKEDASHAKDELFAKNISGNEMTKERVLSAIVSSPRFIHACEILRKTHSLSNVDAAVDSVVKGSSSMNAGDEKQRALIEAIRDTVMSTFGPLVAMASKRSFTHLINVISAKRRLIRSKNMPIPPKLTLDVSYEVLGEDNVCAGDLVTFTFSLKLEARNDETASLPFYLILAASTGKVAALDAVEVTLNAEGEDGERKVGPVTATFALQCVAPNVIGEWSIEACVKSAQYATACDAMMTLAVDLQDGTAEDNDQDGDDWVDAGDDQVDRARAAGRMKQEERIRKRVEALMKRGRK